MEVYFAWTKFSGAPTKSFSLVGSTCDWVVTSYFTSYLTCTMWQQGSASSLSGRSPIVDHSRIQSVVARWRYLRTLCFQSGRSPISWPHTPQYSPISASRWRTCWLCCSAIWQSLSNSYSSSRRTWHRIICSWKHETWWFTHQCHKMSQTWVYSTRTFYVINEIEADNKMKWTKSCTKVSCWPYLAANVVSKFQSLVIIIHSLEKEQLTVIALVTI